MEGLKVRKILYTLIGAAIGVGIDVVLFFAAEILNSMTCGIAYELCDCNGTMSTGSITFFVLVIIASALIGLISGVSEDAEEAIAAERERQEKAAAAFAEYQRRMYEMLEEVNRLINNMRKSSYKCGKFTYVEYDEKKNKPYLKWEFDGGYGDFYKKIWQLKSKIFEAGEPYASQFNDLIRKYILELKNNSVTDHIIKNYDAGDFGFFFLLKKKLHEINQLKYVCQMDCRYDNAINAIESYLKLAQRPFHYIKPSRYGDFILPLDDQKTMSDAKNIIYELKTKQRAIMDNLFDNSDGYYCGFVRNLTEEFTVLSAKIMWYYAKKAPFEVDSFSEAYKVYGKYVVGDNDSVNVEMMLASIYSKLKMGGSELIKQEKKSIEEWVNNHNSNFNELLASGLSWMELYEIEREVLRLMVKNNQQLTPEAQERLKFLESSDAANVKVYEVEPTSEFVFDTSSEKWNESEFEVFFRKVGMKKVSLNYSLVLSSWKKTLPLTLGQQFDQGKVFLEFEKVVRSFNNEVTFRKMTARAVDLNNVIYENSAIFSFTSERNKCLTMVFFCDVFGPTLNITILTLFTPEKEMDIESMQKYAKAIKNNIYVDSFREIILQSIDETLKEKREIYSDEATSSSKKFVE